MTYYNVTITQSAKRKGNNPAPFRIYNEGSFHFSTEQEVKEFLRDEYPKCKRVPAYLDRSDGSSHQVGWIYCHSFYEDVYLPHVIEIQHYWGQDWVKIEKIETIFLNERSQKSVALNIG
jgi:hypothetical protein